jgi:two-component system LytT family response regulator
VEWTEELDPERFVRLSRSLIVNVPQIHRLQRMAGEGARIQFVNSTLELPLGRTANRRLRQLLQQTQSVPVDDYGPPGRE